MSVLRLQRLMKLPTSLLAALLFLSTSFALGKEGNVTFSCEAGTLANVLKQLSQATGMHFKAGSNVEEEILLIAVKDCHVEELKQRLAQVTRAHWKQEQDLWVLARTQADEQKLREEDRQRRVEELRDCLKDLSVTISGDFTPDYSKHLAATLRAKMLGAPNRAPYVSANDDRNKTPAQRALVQLVTQLDPGLFVIQPGDKVIYSNQPNKLELPLPVNCDSIISELVKNQKTWSETVGAMKDELPKDNMLLNPFRNTSPIGGNPNRVLLTIARGNSMAPAVCAFYLLEPDGGIEAQAQLWLTPKRVRDIQQSMLASASHSKEKPIDFSEKSKKLYDHFEQLLQRKINGSTLPAEFRQRYSRPEENDLLSYFPTDALRAIAASKNKNVVASLTDYVLAPATFGRGTLDIDPPTYLGDMVRQGPLKETDDGNWLLLEPLYPVDAAYQRTHRKALGEYLRSIVSEGYEKLDECGKFAWIGRDAPDQGVSFLFANLLDPTGGVNHDFNWPSLRIWGSLTEEERQHLYSGQRLPLSSISPDAGALIAKQLQKQGLGFYSGPSPESERILMNVRTFEAVEALPDGLPRDGYLQLQTKMKPAFFPVYENNKDKWVRSYYDLRSFASELQRKKNPRPEDTSPRMPEFFRIGKEKQMDFEIVFGKTGRIAATFSEIRVDRSSPAITAKELSDEIKRAVAAELQGSP